MAHSTGLAKTFVIVGMVVVAPGAPGLEWAHSDVQLLFGRDFIMGEHDRATATVEHAHGWQYGDNFFFIDLYNHLPERGGLNLEAYGEWYSTLSLNKVFGFQSPIPYLSDLSFSAGINAGSRPTIDPYLAFLGGLRFTLDLPAFEYFSFTPKSSRSKSNPRAACNSPGYGACRWNGKAGGSSSGVSWM